MGGPQTIPTPLILLVQVAPASQSSRWGQKALKLLLLLFHRTRPLSKPNNQFTVRLERSAHSKC